MKNAKHIYAILTFVTILTALGMSAGKGKIAPPAGTQDVKVTNTAATPVPVAGTVQLASGANVAINNGAANPIAVHDNGPANRVTFFKSSGGTMQAGESGGETVIYTVPAGKQLEMRDIYVYARTPSGQSIPAAGFKITGGPQFVQYPVKVEYQGMYQSNSVATFCTTMSNCSFIAGPGCQISAYVERSASTGAGDFSVGINGFLEDVS